MKLQDFIKKHGNLSVDEKELKELLGIKDKKYFIPKEYEEYFVVGLTGEIIDYFNNTDFDMETIENSEVFKTKEEAEEYARKQKFLLQMKRDFLDNSDDIDWEYKGQTKWYVGYDHTTSSLVTGSIFTTQYNDFYTTNKEWLEEYIEKYEEELKRYYFEIKEEK